jgi:hypothetical protein
VEGRRRKEEVIMRRRAAGSRTTFPNMTFIILTLNDSNQFQEEGHVRW